MLLAGIPRALQLMLKEDNVAIAERFCRENPIAMSSEAPFHLMHAAIYTNALAVARVLLSKGRSLVEVDDTCVEPVVYARTADALQLCVDHGASWPHLQTLWSRTLRSRHARSTAVRSLLLKLGLRPSVQDLHLCIAGGWSEDVLRFILQYVDPNAPVELQYDPLEAPCTPLFRAVRASASGAPSFYIARLLEAGAIPSPRDVMCAVNICAHDWTPGSTTRPFAALRMLLGCAAHHADVASAANSRKRVARGGDTEMTGSVTSDHSAVADVEGVLPASVGVGVSSVDYGMVWLSPLQLLTAAVEVPVFILCGHSAACFVGSCMTFEGLQHLLHAISDPPVAPSDWERAGWDVDDAAVYGGGGVSLTTLAMYKCDALPCGLSWGSRPDEWHDGPAEGMMGWAVPQQFRDAGWGSFTPPVSLLKARRASQTAQGGESAGRGGCSGSAEAGMAKGGGLRRRPAGFSDGVTTAGTLIHHAVWCGVTGASAEQLKERVQIVERLAEMGVEVEARDGVGMTALHLASMISQVDIVMQLLSVGASATTRVAVPPPLQDTVRHHMRCRRMMYVDGWSALEIAAESGDESTIRMLVAAGGDVDALVKQHVRPWFPSALVRKLGLPDTAVYEPRG